MKKLGRISVVERLAPDGQDTPSFWLTTRDREVQLTVGEYFIGRNPVAQFPLEDVRVSRNHAVVRVTQRGVVLQDLGSANGVWLNDERLLEPVQLRDGDRFLIGGEEFAFSVGEALRDSASISVVELGPVEPPSVPPVPSTLTELDLDYAARLADRVLASGRLTAAEEVLAEPLARVMEAVNQGEELTDDQLSLAARYALKLCLACKDARWGDYVVRLFTRAERPMEDRVYDELERALRCVPGISPVEIATYRGLLATLVGRVEEAELDRCARGIALPDPL
ncbi:MAG: FHA domain-containing protein [Polyangiaceae bacterium]|nr:FHA domain-containing protein [Polyangiaceae bacterium]MCW5792576.1 FHA domain-containing protein [Polyangiaceae bacterium]